MTLAVVAGVAVWGSTAFFSDTETSTGNVFEAGQVDLKVGNTSYYNGEKSDNTSWVLGDLDDELFFNFTDVKPGDTSEDTIELKVVDNPSWVCATLTLDANDENVMNNPEEKAGDVTDNPEDSFDGELAQELHFVWWPDDGDNVLETDEAPMAYYMWDKLSNLVGDDNVLELTLADSKLNFFTGARPGTPLDGDTPYFIGKAWCMGEMTLDPVAEGEGVNPMVASGVTCNGANVDNKSQTDLVNGTLQFYAEQARHNEQFLCPENRPRAFVLTDASEQNALNTVSQDKPWYTYEINGLCIDFTLHNPTYSPAYFDTQRDNSVGTFYPGLSDLNITEGPLDGQLVGNLYDDDITVPANGGTVNVTKCATNEIKFGIHYGAEQLWYLDWATFTAQAL